MARRQVKRVCLAYSGGLDTSVILHWLIEQYQCEVVAFTADVGQEEELVGAAREGARDRRGRLHRARRARGVRARLRLPGDLGRSAVYEGSYLLGTALARPLIAQAPGRGRARDRLRRGRPRRHRQGQRPGALRAHLPRARARARDHRALARVGPRSRAPTAWPTRRSTTSRSTGDARRSRTRWTAT